MTRYAATRRNINHSQHCGVSPPLSPPCRHVPGQKRRGLSPLSPLSPHPPLDPANLALLIEQLREEGALLQHQENALLVRPTHWQQVDRLSPHWKALLLFLQTNENGENDGSGRSA